MPPRSHATDTGSFIRRKGARHSSGSDGKTKIQDPVQCRVSSYFKETLNLYSLVKDQPFRATYLGRIYGILSNPETTSAVFTADVAVSIE
jgi:hypothetical protein